MHRRDFGHHRSRSIGRRRSRSRERRSRSRERKRSIHRQRRSRSRERRRSRSRERRSRDIRRSRSRARRLDERLPRRLSRERSPSRKITHLDRRSRSPREKRSHNRRNRSPGITSLSSHVSASWDRLDSRDDLPRRGLSPVSKPSRMSKSPERRNEQPAHRSTSRKDFHSSRRTSVEKHSDVDRGRRRSGISPDAHLSMEFNYGNVDRSAVVGPEIDREFLPQCRSPSDNELYYDDDSGRHFPDDSYGSLHSEVMGEDWQYDRYYIEIKQSESLHRKHGDEQLDRESSDQYQRLEDDFTINNSNAMQLSFEEERSVSMHQEPVPLDVKYSKHWPLKIESSLMDIDDRSIKHSSLPDEVIGQKAMKLDDGRLTTDYRNRGSQRSVRMDENDRYNEVIETPDDNLEPKRIIPDTYENLDPIYTERFPDTARKQEEEGYPGYVRNLDYTDNGKFIDEFPEPPRKEFERAFDTLDQSVDFSRTNQPGSVGSLDEEKKQLLANLLIQNEILGQKIDMINKKNSSELNVDTKYENSEISVTSSQEVPVVPEFPTKIQHKILQPQYPVSSPLIQPGIQVPQQIIGVPNTVHPGIVPVRQVGSFPPRHPRITQQIQMPNVIPRQPLILAPRHTVLPPRNPLISSFQPNPVTNSYTFRPDFSGPPPGPAIVRQNIPTAPALIVGYQPGRPGNYILNQPDTQSHIQTQAWSTLPNTSIPMDSPLIDEVQKMDVISENQNATLITTVTNQPTEPIKIGSATTLKCQPKKKWLARTDDSASGKWTGNAKLRWNIPPPNPQTEVTVFKVGGKTLFTVCGPHCRPTEEYKGRVEFIGESTLGLISFTLSNCNFLDEGDYMASYENRMFEGPHLKLFLSAMEGETALILWKIQKVPRNQSVTVLKSSKVILTALGTMATISDTYKDRVEFFGDTEKGIIVFTIRNSLQSDSGHYMYSIGNQKYEGRVLHVDIPNCKKKRKSKFLAEDIKKKKIVEMKLFLTNLAPAQKKNASSLMTAAQKYGVGLTFDFKTYPGPSGIIFTSGIVYAFEDICLARATERSRPAAKYLLHTKAISSLISKSYEEIVEQSLRELEIPFSLLSNLVSSSIRELLGEGETYPQSATLPNKTCSSISNPSVAVQNVKTTTSTTACPSDDLKIDLLHANNERAKEILMSMTHTTAVNDEDFDDALRSMAKQHISLVFLIKAISERENFKMERGLTQTVEQIRGGSDVISNLKIFSAQQREEIQQRTIDDFILTDSIHDRFYDAFTILEKSAARCGVLLQWVSKTIYGSKKVLPYIICRCLIWIQGHLVGESYTLGGKAGRQITAAKALAYLYTRHPVIQDVDQVQGAYHITFEEVQRRADILRSMEGDTEEIFPNKWLIRVCEDIILQYINEPTLENLEFQPGFPKNIVLEIKNISSKHNLTFKAFFKGEGFINVVGKRLKPSQIVKILNDCGGENGNFKLLSKEKCHEISAELISMTKDVVSYRKNPKNMGQSHPDQLSEDTEQIEMESTFRL